MARCLRSLNNAFILNHGSKIHTTSQCQARAYPKIMLGTFYHWPSFCAYHSNLAPHHSTWFKSRPRARQTSRPAHPYPHVKHGTEFKFDDGDPDGDGSETDGSLFEWEEEATLLSDLMEEEPQQTPNQEYDALVESLQDPFLNQGKLLKKEIAGTLVPAANRVKATYRILDQHVDTAYGQGIVQFNKACTEIEETMAIEQTEFREAHQATKDKIDILFERLKKEYAIRDQLWVDVKKAIDEIVAPVIEELKDTPASIERTIVKLEKKSESLEKHKENDNDASTLANEVWKNIF